MFHNGWVAVYGYARVSTGQQTLDAQLDALNAAGCERIFAEKVSGARRDRPQLAELLSTVQAGDTVVVWRLDRLGRDMAHVLSVVEQLKVAGVRLSSVVDGIDSQTSTGRLMIGILASLAEYERELLHERQAAAAAVARANGKHVGRPRRMTADQLRMVCRMIDDGESVTDVCRVLQVPRSTFYRTLRSTAS
jgi:DNA invertase Pin-like site-specific DNA recombinase